MPVTYKRIIFILLFHFAAPALSQILTKFIGSVIKFGTIIQKQENHRIFILWFFSIYYILISFLETSEENPDITKWPDGFRITQEQKPRWLIYSKSSPDFFLLITAIIDPTIAKTAIETEIIIHNFFIFIRSFFFFLLI